MRYKTTKTKNTVQYTIIQDINKNGKRTTCVYENIGNYEKLKLRVGNEDHITWLNNYVKELNKKKKPYQSLSKCFLSLTIYSYLEKTGRKIHCQRYLRYT